MTKKFLFLSAMVLMLSSCEGTLDDIFGEWDRPSNSSNTTSDPKLETPLTLEALTSGTIAVSDPKDGMQYSLNGGAKTAVTTTAINVAAGDKLAFYGNGTSITKYNGTIIAGGTADVKVYGNIMSLVDETGFAKATAIPETMQVFSGLFKGNDHLTDASGLQLPATTLAKDSYHRMFMGCSNLTAAPSKLPATTVSESCYAQMFEGCKSLTTAPELPATKLDSYCYSSMFYGCSSLTVAPALPATTVLACCYQSMFRGCTNLTTAPVLPATTLASSCYSMMFEGCTKLTTAPDLKAETLVDYCYDRMFMGCTSLNAVTCLATDINATGCTKNWLDGVAATGTFTKASSMGSWTTGANGIPSGWTVTP